MSGGEIAELDADRTVELLAAARRIRAAADAAEAHALARLDALRGGDRYVADEAALELRLSRQQAQARLERARQLTRRMPRLLARMHHGDLEGHTAGRVADTVAVLDDDTARQLDARLDEKLDSGRVDIHNPANLARAARRLVEHLDPRGQTARARRARAGRTIELLPGEHGMSTLLFDLPAEIAASAYGRIDATARRIRNTGDARTLDQLRADVAANLLHERTPGSPSTSPKAADAVDAATVFLHMPIDTALGISDSGCELAGYGPLPGPIAREIMSNPNSLWRKVLTDPASGAVHDVGRRYRPTAAIRDLVAIRDAECTIPGCHRPAQRCDFDHQQAWQHGGSTSATNAAAKCEHHHSMKDTPGWTIHTDPVAGTTTLTTPTGRTHTTHHHPKNEPPIQKPPPPATNPPPEDAPPPF
ncbi:DUF222 domain-containing protein [Haloechinothrix sp. LS1_15]|nr:DUF222 domain-containing protein [Haloechinothrix sp. LS1_15]